MCKDILLYSVLAVILDGIKTEDTKESEILAGEEGIQVAKNISREIKRAVDNGNLTLTVNGTVFVPDKESLSISEPKPLCTKGQTLREKYCCKFLKIIHLYQFNE